MKILKESKEKLPVSFLTDFISRGWDDVGYLKETIKSINENFSGTKKVEELLEDLLDAYLVCIGQLEQHLDNKEYLEFPEDSKLTEDININITPKEVKISDNSGEEVGIIPIEPEKEEKFDDSELAMSDADVARVNEPFEEPKGKEKKELPDTPFEYFCDFDEPDMSKPCITDKDLYGEPTEE